MERDELTIDLREMVLYVVRGWKKILLCMVILAVAANFIPLSASQGKADNNEIQKAKKAIEKTSDVNDVDDAFAAYSKYKKQYNNTCDYIKNSVIMELDSAAVATDTVIYSVTSDKANNIAKALTNFTADDTLSKDIASVLDCNAKYAGELVYVDNKTDDVRLDSAKVSLSNDSAIVVLAIYSTQEEKLADMSDGVKKSFEAFADSMHDSYGDFTFENVAEQVGICSSDVVASKQQSVTNSLSSIKTSMSSLSDAFTSEQKAYYDALKDNMNKNDKKQSVSYLNIKYIVLGAVAGCIVSAIVLAIAYILMRKVKAVSDLSESFKIEVIGKPLDCSNQESVRAGVDYICTQLGVVSAKSNNNRIVFTSTVDEHELNGVSVALKEALKENISDASYIGSIISEAGAVKSLENANGVVLVEKLFKTTYDDLESEILLCRRMNVPVIGCVVVK